MFNAGDKVSYFSRRRGRLVTATVIEECNPLFNTLAVAKMHECTWGAIATAFAEFYYIRLDESQDCRTIYGARLMLVQSIDGRPISTQQLKRSHA